MNVALKGKVCRNKWDWKIPLLCLCFVSLSSINAYGNFDNALWNALLKEHVRVIDGGQATQVNYGGMLADRDRLRIYLDQIAEVKRDDFDNWQQSEQLAFLINTYNAWTVELVLTEYPDLGSIRQIGLFPFSAWRRNIVNLFGKHVSLGDVEHGMIRGWGIYNEPRIHFAVNCAAIGCPALRAEAYVGHRLERQLEENTKLFLQDRSRNYFSEGRLYVSRIFDWYREDFEQGWLGVNSVSEFLASYANEIELTENGLSQLEQNDIHIRYLRYDWDLNGAN